MALNQFQENGVTFIQVYASCPECFVEGKTTQCESWKHGDNNCFGDMYVGDNAFFKCEKCGRSSHVKNWKYLCPSHSNSIGTFMTDSNALSPTDCQGVCGAISTAGQLTLEAGVSWLEKFLENIDE